MINIPSINLPSLPTVENSFSSLAAKISDFLPEFKNLKIGESLFVKLIIDGNLVNLPLDKAVALAAVKPAANLPPRELPVKLEFSEKLVFSEPKEVVIHAKVSSQSEGGTEIKLQSINNLPPEKFAASKHHETVLKSAPQPPQNPNIAKTTFVSNQSESVILQKPEAAALPKINLSAIRSQNLAPELKTFPELAEKNVIVSLKAPLLAGSEQPQPLAKPAELAEYLLKENFPPTVKNIIGEVLKRDENFLHIKTPAGEIKSEIPLKFEPGTKLLLELDIVKERSQPAVSLEKNGLTETLKPLLQTQSPLMQKIIDKIPSMGKEMVSRMLSVIKAETAQDISQWLGKGLVRELESSPEGKIILDKISQFFASPRTETPLWRIMEIPLFAEGDLSKIRIAVKKNEDEEDDENRPSSKQYGTRFVIDLNLSRLGKFQLDGFSIAERRRFDLVIRTEKEINKDIYYHILNLFKTSLHDVDFVGNLSVNIKESFIKICEDENLQSTIKDGIFA